MSKIEVSDAEKSLLDILRQTDTSPEDLRTVLLRYPSQIKKVILGVRDAKERALESVSCCENELVIMLLTFISALERTGLTLDERRKYGIKALPIIYSDLTLQNLKQLYSQQRIGLHLPENAENFNLSTKMARMETADGELLSVQLNMPEKTLCIRLTENNQGLFC